MKLISENAPGIIQSLIAAVIVSVVTYLVKILNSPQNAASVVVPCRNIRGYVFGWLFMIFVVPLIVCTFWKPSDQSLVKFIVIDATSISVIGWLDRYIWIRRNFGGSRFWDSFTLPLLSFPVASLLTMTVGESALFILRLATKIF